MNNSELIGDLLDFPFPDCFYFVEVIQRRKENPEMKKHSLTLADYYISSYTSFLTKFEEIKKMCDAFNARAYIRLNYRRYEQIAMKVNLKVAELICEKNYKAIMAVYPAVVGKIIADPDKKWLIDLDGDQIGMCGAIADIVSQLNPKGIVEYIPTKNGVHIITRKFDTLKFQQAFPDFNMEDVKKDANTILYQAG